MRYRDKIAIMERTKAITFVITFNKGTYTLYIIYILYLQHNFSIFIICNICILYRIYIYFQEYQVTNKQINEIIKLKMSPKGCFTTAQDIMDQLPYQ